MRTGLLKLRHLYKYIPTSLTLGNSLLGFGAILYTLHAYAPEAGEEIPELLATSAWMIVFAMIFDMLDGWSARLLNASSEHGMQMDSLADMVTFGVAPAVIVAVMAHTDELAVLPYRWVWVLCAIYLGCVALRLALYNVMANNPEMKKKKVKGKGASFHGLPSPGGAAAVCSLVILYSGTEYQFIVVAQLLPIYAGILGFLMVSPIPYAHIGQWLGSKHHYSLKILALILFAIVFSWNPRVVAAIAINLYILSGPISAIMHWFRHTEEEEDSPAPQHP